MKMINKTESGRSMIEMLGVLAIIGVLSVGGLAGYNMAMGRVRVNRVIDELQLVAVNVRTAVPNGVYDNIGTIVNSMGILTTLNENLAALGAGAKAEVISQKSIGGTKLDRFAISFVKLPVDACRRIAGLDWGTESYVAADTEPKDGSQVTTTNATGSSGAIGLCKETTSGAGVTFSLMLK